MHTEGTASASPLNAARALTPLVGREDAVRDVCRRLLEGDAPLLTLTGPGGVGKTRLARVVAERLTDSYADGAVLVSLASIVDPRVVVPTIAQAVGLHTDEHPGLLEDLKDFLAPRELLLVLDNFEHLAAEASTLAALVAACPRLTLLVTSRASLRLSAERELPVPPLELPPRGAVAAEELAGVPSAQLYLDRARAVNPAFSLTDENATAVAEICRALDGLPLALELAAGRAKVLAPHELLARLDRRLELLTGGAHDLPARQRTLRATLAWSHALLGADEQRLVAWLSVFAGGFDLAAAETIGAEVDPSLDVLGGATALLDNSLLAPAGEGDSRLTMLETVREFAAERLAEQADDARPIHRAHARFYATVAARSERAMTGAEQRAVLARLAREHDNLRAALAWSLRAEPETALRLAGSLWRFWLVGGHLDEGRRGLSEALARAAGAPEALRARALVGAGALEYYAGDLRRAAVLCGSALDVARSADDRSAIVSALSACALVRAGLGDAHEARALYDEALRLSDGKSDVDRWSAARALYGLGWVAAAEDYHDEALRCYAEAIATFDGLGDRDMTSSCLTHLAALAASRRRWEDAARLLGASERAREESGAHWRPSIWADNERTVAAARAALGEAAYAAAARDGAQVEPGEAVNAYRDASGDSEPDLPAGLTAREVEILKLVASGLSDAEVAARLVLSARTVHAHLRSIYRKLGVRSRTAAAGLAARRGLLD